MDLSEDAIIASEEETSNDEEQLSEQGSELERSEESIADQDDEHDLDASATDSNEDDENALEESATDSDEDESEVENDIEEKKNEKRSKSEKVKEAIYQRYQERQGKQLYIRFPHKVPETQEALEQKVKELTPLAIKAHKPRQRHVRFCLIDFATKEDRDAALNILRKSIKKGDLKKFAVSIPRTESLDFVKELADRKVKSIENKKAKLRLKRASKKALKENKFTSTVVVLNLPKNASILQVREFFENAVDINIKPAKGKIRKDTSIAAVTFPTTHDARNAIKKKLFLGGNQLVIKFDNKKFVRKSKSKIAPKTNEQSQESEPATKRPKLELDTDNQIGKLLIKAPPQKSKSKNVPKNNGKSHKFGPAIERPKLEVSLKNTKRKISTKTRTDKSSKKFPKNKKSQHSEPATERAKLEPPLEDKTRNMSTNVLEPKPKVNKTNKFKNNDVKNRIIVSKK